MPPDRIALFGLDGLSKEQFQHLLTCTPELSTLLDNGSLMTLDAAPFSDTHPIWAELLTGKPWYQNGCAGYAKPTNSLSAMKIFSESDLLVPIQLLPQLESNRHHVVINIPITEPKETERKWLASACSPTKAVVSPNSLSDKFPYSEYVARSILCIADVFANPTESISALLKQELQRLDCALELCESANWQTFLYRTNLFDQLAHLLGPNFIFEMQLKVWTELTNVITKLAALVRTVLARCDNYAILSAFSHVPCKAIFSLNDFFETRHLLKRSATASSQYRLRRQAFAAARGETEKPLISESISIAPLETLCCSPVRGAVFVNSKDFFDDGCVNHDQIKPMEEKIAALVKLELLKLGSTKFHMNPNQLPGLPNFIIDTDGFDLSEYLGEVLRLENLPRTTHHSTGFIWSRARTKAKQIKSIDVANIVLQPRVKD